MGERQQLVSSPKGSARVSLALAFGGRRQSCKCAAFEVNDFCSLKVSCWGQGSAATRRKGGPCTTLSLHSVATGEAGLQATPRRTKLFAPRAPGVPSLPMSAPTLEKRLVLTARLGSREKPRAACTSRYSSTFCGTRSLEMLTLGRPTGHTPKTRHPPPPPRRLAPAASLASCLWLVFVHRFFSPLPRRVRIADAGSTTSMG